MTRNVEKTKQVKKYSKVRLLQILGLLNRTFNDQTSELERSLPLTLIFVISLISKFFLPTSYLSLASFHRTMLSNSIWETCSTI